MEEAHVFGTRDGLPQNLEASKRRMNELQRHINAVESLRVGEPTPNANNV